MFETDEKEMKLKRDIAHLLWLHSFVCLFFPIRFVHSCFFSCQFFVNVLHWMWPVYTIYRVWHICEHKLANMYDIPTFVYLSFKYSCECVCCLFYGLMQSKYRTLIFSLLSFILLLWLFNTMNLDCYRYHFEYTFINMFKINGIMKHSCVKKTNFKFIRFQNRIALKNPWKCFKWITSQRIKEKQQKLFFSLLLIYFITR